MALAKTAAMQFLQFAYNFQTVQLQPGFSTKRRRFAARRATAETGAQSAPAAANFYQN
jgi:hypothetical protein